MGDQIIIKSNDISEQQRRSLQLLADTFKPTLDFWAVFVVRIQIFYSVQPIASISLLTAFHDILTNIEIHEVLKIKQNQIKAKNKG